MTDKNNPDDEGDSESSQDVIEETVEGQRDAIEAFKEELDTEDSTETDEDCCEE